MMRFFLFICLLVVVSMPALAADPVMERINKTQTIRCGYVSYTPGSYKDENDKLVGHNIDIMEEAAHRMGLTVEWAYETNWPVISADMQAGKFDVLCVGYWSNPVSSKTMLTTNPLFYQPVFFASRMDDHRFDQDVTKVNHPDVRISYLEGDVPEKVVEELYPKATKVPLSQMSSFSQNFHEVAAGKADVTITSTTDMLHFQEHNPDTLKVIDDQPVRLYSCAMMLPADAYHLKNLLDVTFREMQLDGTIEKILKTYAQTPHDFYYADAPYQKAH